LSREDVNRDTAIRLKTRRQHCETLFFATSKNLAKSKWMLWELGYFDGIRGKVAILPLVFDFLVTDAFAGHEYLEVYPYNSHSPSKSYSKDILWVNWSEDVYVPFEGWLQGTEPMQH
jgi:hypothetical protein